MFAVRILSLVMLCSSVTVAYAQSEEDEILRSVVFAAVDQERDQANAAGAPQLAPTIFQRAEEQYRSAQRELESGRKLDRIRPRLNKAIAEYQRAAEIAVGAKEDMAAMIKGRADAIGVEASAYDETNWRAAERAFDDALSAYERDRKKQALARAADAESRYRAAELTAIKAAYLTEARRLLEEADDQRADRLAPRTFASATSLLDAAERGLAEDRYDVDRPRDLARQAQYEAGHAIYLAGVIDQARKDRTELEDFILAGEAPLQAIAGALNLKVGFATGYDAPAQQIIAAIQSQQEQARELLQDLRDRDDQIEALRSQLIALEERFGSIASERQALEQQLADQARRRNLFRHAQTLFVEGDADVLTAGDDVIIRLGNDLFRVGTVELQSSARSKLDRVVTAIQLYGTPLVRIEGHTDSFGGDAVNMQLSQDRANVVLRYLIDRLPPEGVTMDAVGFGETRPIANNETREGRERNRRVDIVIRPRT